MHIAIIEDEKKLAETLQQGLVDEGYSVSCFFDGEKASQEMKKSGAQYSLAVLDLMLPYKNGLELCKEFRSAGLLFPIIVLTAKDTLEEKVQLLNAGADDFISKPFSFEELVARVRAHLRRAQGFSASKIVIGNLTIETSTHRVLREDKVIYLTPTEFKLICLLAENPERILSREEISSYLWEVEDGTMTNIVDVHISNLRKKLDDPYEQKVIRTVRGTGYSIQKHHAT